MQFSSGVYLPIDSVSVALRPGYCHDADPKLMDVYLEHYQSMDPYVTEMPCLVRPNTAIRFSDVADIARLAQREFGEFMKQAPYFHALAVVPSGRQGRIGVFSIHRRRRQRDFDEAERQFFEWYVAHVARAIDYHRLRQQLNGEVPIVAIVLSEEGRILSLNEDARLVLESLPAGRRFRVPAASDRPVVWRVRGDAFLVRATVLPPDSLLNIRPQDGLDSGAHARRIEQRLQVCTAGARARRVVTLEPLAQSPDRGAALFGLPFTKQEAAVAVLLVKGRSPKQVAEEMSLSLNTTREYIERCYRKANVCSLDEFLHAFPWVIDAGTKG